jgi:hypothetical protein
MAMAPIPVYVGAPPKATAAKGKGKNAPAAAETAATVPAARSTPAIPNVAGAQGPVDVPAFGTGELNRILPATGFMPNPPSALALTSAEQARGQSIVRADPEIPLPRPRPRVRPKPVAAAAPAATNPAATAPAR